MATRSAKGGLWSRVLLIAVGLGGLGPVGRPAQARPVDDTPLTASKDKKKKDDRPKAGGGQGGQGQSSPPPRPQGGQSGAPSGGQPARAPVTHQQPGQPALGPSAAGPSTAGAAPQTQRAPSRPAGQPTDGRSVRPSGTQTRPVPGAAPQGTTRAYDARGRSPPPSRTDDHRYGRPESHHVRPASQASHPPPDWSYYRPHYTHWYVHPYYRSLTATVLVLSFGFAVDPWVTVWVPPSRPGWAWVGGYYDPLGFWIPGHWEPMVAPPAYYPTVRYVFVPGYWESSTYVDGYWRADHRDGWTWVEGYYLADGTYVSGHWQPDGAPPAGYTWEPGYFDGQVWVEGFYRPEFRDGYIWVSSYFDASGIYHGGYWMPQEDRPGNVYIPGWFDGNTWVDGYWVGEAEYYGADAQSWTPPEGWNDGWDQSADGSASADDDGPPLALPVE